MKNRALLSLAAVLAVIGVTGLYFYYSQITKRPPVPSRLVEGCGELSTLDWKDERITIGGAKLGGEVAYVEGYYACHPVVAGELVLYRFSKSRDPVIRRVRAVPGDKFDVIQEKSTRQWNLKVNGELITLQNGEPFRFGAEPPPPLKLYEKDRAETGLKPNEAIVAVDNGNGFLDSGMFGVVSVTDFLGRVIETQ